MEKNRTKKQTKGLSDMNSKDKFIEELEKMYGTYDRNRRRTAYEYQTLLKWVQGLQESEQKLMKTGCENCNPLKRRRRQ